jgi:hypothetical protein
MLLRCFVLLLLSAPACAQLWPKTKVEVRPGEGVGPISLGKTVADISAKYLGKVQLQEAPGTLPGSGFALFGKGDSRDLKRGILLRLHDGVKPENIYAIQVKGLRAATREGIYLGGPAAQVPKRYPDAQKDLNPFNRQPEYVLPGLTIRTLKSKVEEFVIEPKDRSRWRFTELPIVPGSKVGPFEINKPVPESAFQLLGQPTLEVKPGKTQGSGLLRWSIPGQNPNRLIEVVLHNGQAPRAIVSVRVRGVRALTDHKVKLGDTAQLVRDLYPDGREGLHSSTGGETWRVPGANFVLTDGRLKEIFVYAVPRGRNR